MEKYLNSALSPEERAEDLLYRMTLEEKMAQLSCVLPNMDVDMERLERFCVNGIGQVSCLEMRTLETVEEVAAFQHKFQKVIMEKSRFHIPAIFHMEGLCGPLFQGTTSFPAGISRGSGWDRDLEEQIGRIVGRQEKAAGITNTLAPVLDVARDPRMGRQCESYGEDPTLCAALGSAYAAGVQSGEVDGRHTDAVAKHFLGFHQSAGGIHGAHSDVPARELREIFAKPFQAAITESGLKGVMPCYCSIDGEPIHGSKALLTGLLREEMGFEGVVFSDYGGVSNIHNAQHGAESLVEAGAMALEAGMDMETPSPNCYNESLIQYIREGKLEEKYVDRAALRVLTAKFRMGLFEHPFALTGDALLEQLDNARDREVTLQAARQSLILLKNDGTLPIGKQVKKITVLGSQAVNARIFFGGYTHLSMVEASLAAGASMAGVEPKPWQTGVYTPIPGTPIQPDTDDSFDRALRTQKPGCKNLWQQLQQQFPQVEFTYSYGYTIAGDDYSHHDAAIEACRDADLVLMVIGGKNGSGSIATMGEGVDGTYIGLPRCQEVLIQKLHRLGRPLVGLHFDGRPCSSNVADACFNAILECWSPAEAGAQAIAEVLRGDYNPSGKLPVTVARSAGQLPIYYNHPHGSSWHQGESIGFTNYVDMTHLPRYPFGHGLSYTSFTYADLQLSHTPAQPGDTVEISCTVENTGSVFGTEVVQLYISDPFASMSRPVQELEGFARMALAPGEKKKVSFRLKLSQLAFLDKQMRWKVEHGQILLRLASSSEDVRLEGSVQILADAYVEGKSRGFWAEATCES